MKKLIMIFLGALVVFLGIRTTYYFIWVDVLKDNELISEYYSNFNKRKIVNLDNRKENNLTTLIDGFSIRNDFSNYEVESSSNEYIYLKKKDADSVITVNKDRISLVEACKNNESDFSDDLSKSNLFFFQVNKLHNICKDIKKDDVKNDVKLVGYLANFVNKKISIFTSLYTMKKVASYNYYALLLIPNSIENIYEINTENFDILLYTLSKDDKTLYDITLATADYNFDIMIFGKDITIDYVFNLISTIKID